MSNFINPSVLAAEALDQLEYELVAGNLVYRDRSSDFAASRGLKVGDSVQIRTVTDFRTDTFTAGNDIVAQEVQQSSTQLQIERHFDVSVTVGARERALNLDGIRKEIINPAMVSLAQKIDSYLLEKIIESQGLYSSTTLLDDAADIALANRSAILQQISKVGRIGLVNVDLEATLLGTDVFSKFDTRGEPGVTALQEASMGRLLGTDWFSSVNMPSNSDTNRTTIGTGVGVLVITSPTQVENLQGQSVITTTATTVGNFEVGDKILIAGAKRSYTVATQATVGATTIAIEEQINENLSALNGAAITVVGSGATSIDYQGVFFNQGAYGFAAPPLDAAAGDKAGVAIANGMSIRMTEAYDITTKSTIWSFDMLIGGKCIDPRLSMLLGNQV